MKIMTFNQFDIEKRKSLEFGNCLNFENSGKFWRCENLNLENLGSFVGNSGNFRNLRN